MRTGIVSTLSPISSLTDPWVADRKRYTEPTSRVFVELIGRRRISLHRTRQLALKLLDDIEGARLQAAREEASKAFDVGGIV